MAGSGGEMWEWQLFGLAAAVRLLFLRFTGIPAELEGRVELSNLQNGIRSVREAIHLLQHNVPIYQNGSTCQPSPLIVTLVRFFGWLGMEDVLFVGLDLLAALLVFRIVERLRERAKLRHEADVPPSDFNPAIYSSIYLFHPFSILMCLAKSSAILTTLSILASFHFALSTRRRSSMAMLSLATSLSIYPILLLVPLVLLVTEGAPRRIGVAMCWNYVSWLVIWSAAAWSISSIPAPLKENFFSSIKDFLLYATPIGCNCFVSDLKPNLGLAWYLFVEMFDHFRPFFLAVFQLNIFVHLAPATIRFSKDPVTISAFLVAVQSIFKPYPTLADSVLLLIFLGFAGPSLLRRSIIFPFYLFAMIAFSLLGPINWHYWIQQGSGNANFFYAITLFYNSSHICLVLDFAHQWIRRDVQRLNPGVDLSTMYQH